MLQHKLLVFIGTCRTYMLSSAGLIHNLTRNQLFNIHFEKRNFSKITNSYKKLCTLNKLSIEHNKYTYNNNYNYIIVLFFIHWLHILFLDYYNILTTIYYNLYTLHH